MTSKGRAVLPLWVDKWRRPCKARLTIGYTPRTLDHCKKPERHRGRHRGERYVWDVEPVGDLKWVNQ